MPDERRTTEGALLRAGLTAVMADVAALVPDGRHATVVGIYDKQTGAKFGAAARVGKHVVVDLVVGLERLQAREFTFRVQGVW